MKIVREKVRGRMRWVSGAGEGVVGGRTSGAVGEAWVVGCCGIVGAGGGVDPRRQHHPDSARQRGAAGACNASMTRVVFRRTSVSSPRGSPGRPRRSPPRALPAKPPGSALDEDEEADPLVASERSPEEIHRTKSGAATAPSTFPATREGVPRPSAAAVVPQPQPNEG